MHSLLSLNELAKIDVLSPLAEHCGEVVEVAQLSLTKGQQKRLHNCKDKREGVEIMLSIWKPEHSHCPRTWTSLMHILLHLELHELHQQLKDYLSKSMSIATIENSASGFHLRTLIGGGRMGVVCMGEKFPN